MNEIKMATYHLSRLYRMVDNGMTAPLEYLFANHYCIEGLYIHAGTAYRTRRTIERQLHHLLEWK